MPKVTLTPSAASDAAIAASATRDYLEFALSPGAVQTEVRFSIGATYAADDSQVLNPGDVRQFEGPRAKSAISFSAGTNVIDVSEV